MFEAHDTHAFREVTSRITKTMAGVMSPSFRCRVCGNTKPTAGRKPMAVGYPKLGYRCAECVARKEAA